MMIRAALLALALAPLAGCGEGSAPASFNTMEMQAPAPEEDPVLKAERDYNAQFNRPKP